MSLEDRQAEVARALAGQSHADIEHLEWGRKQLLIKKSGVVAGQLPLLCTFLGRQRVRQLYQQASERVGGALSTREFVGILRGRSVDLTDAEVAVLAACEPELRRFV